MDKLEKREHIREQIVFWELRLAEVQRQHINLLLIEVNNVDTWERNLKNEATQLAFIWREIKNLQLQLKGEN